MRKFQGLALIFFCLFNLLCLAIPVIGYSISHPHTSQGAAAGLPHQVISSDRFHVTFESANKEIFRKIKFPKQKFNFFELDQAVFFLICTYLFIFFKTSIFYSPVLKSRPRSPPIVS